MMSGKYDMQFFGTERSLPRAMFGMQLRNRKIFKDLVLMLALNETLDQLV